MRCLPTRVLVLVLLVSTWLVAAIAPSVADPGFRLPFEPGRQFPITQGPGAHAAGPYPDYNRHAVDFALPSGTPVLASAGGTIQFEGYDSTGAIQVRVDHGGDRCTQYVHLSRTIIDRGQTVQRGQLLGYSGSTGISSGPHLHWNMVYCSTQRSREVVNTLEMGTSYPIGTSARSQNTAGNDPVGSFDELVSPAPGVVRVRGWALDRDNPGAATGIHVYVGGPAGSAGARGFDIGPAAASRPDVANAYPGVGERHGFDVSLEVGAGRLPVYVYAINLAGSGGSNVLLGRRDVTVSNPDPVGSLDSVSSPQGGELHVGGWTFDPSNPREATGFHVYVGGPAGDPRAESFDLGLASVSRPDVGRVYPAAGEAHGFDTTFPTGKVGLQPVFVYGIDTGPGDNVLIGSGTVEIGVGPPRIGATKRASVVGRPAAGRTVRAGSTSWTVRSVTVRYQWFRDGKPVAGATRSTYRVRKADRAKRIKVRVEATRAGYVSGATTSRAVKVRPPHRR
ncbi:M23 family metallopeptidase [Nocardioides sp. 1609]|uniref:M23 family metallopeptidase n=1 Tax=Nocardioides sp. 1609 TaxID=2508327 RepID=UPI00106FDC2F|nr:M23 family metallopeptidase [Nocardioides sp. 1609]